jgi:hypothetical protein
MAAGLVCTPPFMAGSLLDEFDKFTKDMTEFPEPLSVHLCVDEGAEHRIQAGARNARPQHIETSFLEFASRGDRRSPRHAGQSAADADPPNI